MKKILNLLKLLLTTSLSLILAALFIVLTLEIFYQSYYLYLSPKVITLQTPFGGGTGFFIQTPKGVKILTNAHICRLAMNDYLLATKESGASFPVKVIKIAEDGADLCLVESPPYQTGLSLGHSPWKQEPLAYLGHPGMEVLSLSFGHNLGEIQTSTMDPTIAIDKCVGARYTVVTNPETQKLVCIELDRGMMTDIIMSRGASGSPVVDLTGRLIGVVFSINTQTHHGVMVPFDSIQRLLLSM